MGANGAGAWGARALLLSLVVTGTARAQAETPAPAAPALAEEQAAPATPAVATADGSKKATKKASAKKGAAGAAAGASAGASASTATDGPGAETSDATDPSEPCAAGASCDEGAAPVPEKLEVRVGGRVFARAGADEREAFARTLTLPSARVGVDAAWGLVDAELSAELTSRTLLRDALLRLRDPSDTFRLSAGQFKSPFMARQLESAWDLPLLSRGLVEDFVVDTHGLGGRKAGLMLEARPDALPGKLRAAVGVFRGARDADTQRTGEDVAARLTARPFKGLTLGASGYAADVGGSRRHWSGGGDLLARFKKVSLQAEALTGVLPAGRFTSQTAIAWVDVPLDGREVWGLQPLLGAEALQLRGEGGAVAGQGWSMVGGANVLYGDFFKLLLQAERALKPGDTAPGTSVALQLGARFK
jgi:hypothetical protein